MTTRPRSLIAPIEAPDPIKAAMDRWLYEVATKIKELNLLAKRKGKRR